jgi:hypothetical protein
MVVSVTGCGIFPLLDPHTRFNILDRLSHQTFFRNKRIARIRDRTEAAHGSIQCPIACRLMRRPLCNGMKLSRYPGRVLQGCNGISRFATHGFHLAGFSRKFVVQCHGECGICQFGLPVTYPRTFRETGRLSYGPGAVVQELEKYIHYVRVSFSSSSIYCIAEVIMNQTTSTYLSPPRLPASHFMKYFSCNLARKSRTKLD